MTYLPQLHDLSLSLAQFPDPRRTCFGHFLHPIGNILFIALLAIHCGCSTYVQMSDFAKDHKGWLSQFIDLRFGIPSDDTIRRTLDANFQNSVSIQPSLPLRAAILADFLTHLTSSQCEEKRWGVSSTKIAHII